MAQFPSIAVNLSASALGHEAILNDLKRAQGRGEVDLSRLTLEVTESAVLADFEGAKGLLAEVRSLGVQLVIDDFGTGFSSLALLLELDVDYFKVGMAFVREMKQSTQDRHLVKAVVEMAHGLGLLTIAEGVESAEVLAELETLGGRLCQGVLHFEPARWCLRPTGSRLGWLQGAPRTTDQGELRTYRSPGSRRAIISNTGYISSGGFERFERYATSPA